ncbi:hypothetical protein LPC08_10345 [Roseomonas sp. OT10]|uniref:hypothetical protein n=1 Tax=Roseomonas cutis TaxID=2897332 RepID=UPI001E340979|nr:hypothetical protein [Roseomonas sp. OT10]UFN50975.1 hypothetical protein LPC08_10345 [Roseomonas sp. OT10]
MDIIFGDTDPKPGSDKVTGTSGKDILQSGNSDGSANTAQQQFFGGEGSDTFILRMKDFVTDGDFYNKYVSDFQGAGGWSATNNDFVAFTGFGSGATLELVGEAGVPEGYVGSLLKYTVHTSTGDYNLLIHSVDGKALGAGDYAFYA